MEGIPGQITYQVELYLLFTLLCVDNRTFSRRIMSGAGSVCDVG